ncbi:hypothetical protein KJ365_07670 [Glaciecola sp. XM2]|jgi:hypothetical protein|uniref:hypothetical protein n=1 Tax=Glaciecola sp. XM2 TaxID=1914931 RepID=UPI001BDE0002|nr:hypothetical protein [Glaciecola sp. XM2]MBT1450760.1 hypothetical protein [Glaciecola sp. XM2]
MDYEALSELSDEQLLVEAKKAKSSAITHAFLIGFLAGIILFSVFANSIGLVTLIPLFLIYKLVKPSAQKDVLERVLKERNLK